MFLTFLGGVSVRWMDGNGDGDGDGMMWINGEAQKGELMKKLIRFHR